MSAVHGALENL